MTCALEAEQFNRDLPLQLHDRREVPKRLSEHLTFHSFAEVLAQFLASAV